MAPPAKRRKVETSKAEEIVFDKAARQDYLTGFHKRKVQRTKLAQEAAAKRARQEKIEDRKKLREERKADIERHVHEVNEWIHPQGVEAANEINSDDSQVAGEEWQGIDSAPATIHHEEEYIDEDKYTTVTVETMDVTREGLAKATSDSDSEAGADELKTLVVKDKPEKRKPQPSKKAKENKTKLKKKRKEFRYESKADRRQNRLKERAKNSKQARMRRNG